MDNYDFKEQLNKQDEKMDIIKSQMLKIDPENPAFEIFEALYLEVGRALSDLTALKDKYGALEEEKGALEEEKDHMLSLLKYRDYENDCLRKDISVLEAWLEKIEKSFNMLINTYKWKIGSFAVGLIKTLSFKRDLHKTEERILKVFSDFNDWQRNKNNKVSPVASSDIYDNIMILQQFLRQLRKNFKALEETTRWKSINFLGRFSNLLQRRKKTSAQIQNIDRIFASYDNWQNHNVIGDINILCSWLEKFEKNYRSLLRKPRYRLGNALFSFINMILLRGKEQKSSKKIENTLSQYHQWRSNYQ